MPFDSTEVRQTPLAWGSGEAQLHANGDRQDGLPEDVINPMQRGKADRQQYILPEDCEEPQGFTFPSMFFVRIVFTSDEELEMNRRSNFIQDNDEIQKKKQTSKPTRRDSTVTSCMIQCAPDDKIQRHFCSCQRG